ncbi:hypothetical protein [Halalkalibacterium ligniniphilum]|uniref:hypothetical protein n=1 Tax=Halalkalibacterium ligniniphilum TaxID=1134413 RepID=UPI000344B37D|nr:hypothetical protein [Halalkalibacterium ligniniphilum]
MVLFLISYGFHLLVSLIFFLLIPLPYLIKGSLLDNEKAFQTLLKVYKRILWIAHGALIVALVSGLIMVSEWTDPWLWVVILIWLALGAFLGLTAKKVRLILEAYEKSEEPSEHVDQLKLYSFLLMLAILSMFTVKIIRYL